MDERFPRPSDDELIATAASVLFDDGNLDAVKLLLDCTLTTNWATEALGDYGLDLILTGAYPAIKEFRRLLNVAEERGEEPVFVSELREAFAVSLPPPYYIGRFVARVSPIKVSQNWREELLAAIRGDSVHNQAVGNETTNIYIWEGLRFRSKTETKIAQALDRMGILFFPNCKARLGQPGRREGREPDFLICYNGKWGILEVDGEPYHPASRAVHDHARDRLFKPHGITFFEHYDAQECYKNPDQVVKEFLTNLAKS